MMNVLFYDTGDVRGELNEPIGIELLAANVLKKLGGTVSVDLKWYNFDSYHFDPMQYDIIGISIHINGLDVFERIYRLCRESGFRGMLVAGNSIATFAYEALLEQYPDIICSIGEGEDTIAELIREYRGGGSDFSHIPNLAYLCGHKLIVTERKACSMKAYLPPIRAFSKQIREHKGIVRMEASRGCTWNRCSFCGAAHKYGDAGWRPIDVGLVLKQLVELSQEGLYTVFFCDEDFIGNDSGRFASIVDGISEKMQSGEISPDMKFFISIKPSDVIKQGNIEIIKRFVSCGLHDLFIGLESGCEGQLKRYHKCANVKINTMAAEKILELQEYNLTLDIGFIFFDDKMTPDDIMENIKFIEDNRLYALASSLIKPVRIQPFTKMFADTPEVQGNRLSVDDLLYPYRFADDVVEKVYNVYAGLPFESIAHKIQSVFRREMSDEAGRKRSEKKLIALRYLEFTAIKKIADCYIQGAFGEFALKAGLDGIIAQAAQLLEEEAVSGI